MVERELGHGGWATVYLARDVKHERPVAIKVFHPELAAALGPERFLREIALVARFQHPHILPLHDSGTTDEALYYVMPYVEGESLRDRLRREGPLPIPDAIAIAREVASALAYAHAHGVVHRDVKPENILLSNGHAVVADFGVALALRAARDEAAGPEMTVGTPAYMSPEQAAGGAVDGRSDVYALGCVVYEMLTGLPPFRGAAARTMEQRTLPPLAELRPEVPPAVEQAVLRALQSVPDERFATVREFAETLTSSRVTGPIWQFSGGFRATPKRRRVAVVGALLVLVLAIAGVALWRERRERLDSVSSAAVAVFPFTVRGNASLGYLTSGMVDLLGTDLDGAGDLRAIDAHAVIGSLGPDGARGLTPVRAAEVARRLGAGLFVLGSVLEVGGELRIHAALYESRKPDVPLAQASVDGDDEQIFDLVDRLASQLIGERGRGPAGRLNQLAALTTPSLPALKAYLAGEQLLRAGRPDSAAIAFERAVAQDTAFALAHYRRAIALEWSARFEEASVAAQAAFRHAGRLQPAERALLAAFATYNSGRAAEAEAQYREILRAHPDNVEAWYQLGEVLFHYGPARGGSLRDSREPFQRALALDPANTDAALHLLDVTAAAQDWPTFDSLLAGSRIGDSTFVLRRRAIRAFSVGSARERAQVYSELRDATDGSVLVAAWGLVAFSREIDGAERIARLLLDATRPAATRAFGHALLAQLALARGRWSLAERELAAAAPLDPVLALEYRAWMTTLPFVPASPPDLRGLRAALVAFDPGTAVTRAEGTPVVRVHDDAHAALRLYLLGLVDARLGDSASVEQWASELERLPPVPNAPSFTGDLALGVRAQAVMARGNAAGALALLERMRGIGSLALVANSPFFAHANERWLRAEALVAAGRDREAMRWYESLGEARFDAAYVGAAQQRLTRLYVRLRDDPAAYAHRRRFEALWERADPPVRAALERTGEATR